MTQTTNSIFSFFCNSIFGMIALLFNIFAYFLSYNFWFSFLILSALILLYISFLLYVFSYVCFLLSFDLFSLFCSLLISFIILYSASTLSSLISYHLLYLHLSHLLHSHIISSSSLCSVLLCSVLFCCVLFCSILFCSVLFCSVLFCSALCVVDQTRKTTKSVPLHSYIIFTLLNCTL